LRYGFNLLLEHKDEIETICPDAKEYIETIAHETAQIYGIPIFTFSLSEKDDLLSQWRGYGRGNKSICIGFLKDNLIKVSETNKLIYIDLQKIIYNKDDQKKLLFDFFKEKDNQYKNTNAMLLNLLANQSNYSDIINILIKFKHHRWDEEQEWRLITSFENDSTVRFLGGSKWLKPYVDLKYEKIPISNIKIPHSGYENKNKSSIELLLKTIGKDDIDVDISEIPIVY